MKEIKKILIVEDELPLLRVLTDRFSAEGFVVFQASNGAEGYKAALESHPDIILLDLLMPLVDGNTMLAKIRKDPEGKNIPVMVLTNVNDAKTVSQAMSNGAHDYLVKSDWNIEDLVKKVKERLSI